MRNLLSEGQLPLDKILFMPTMT